MTQVARNVTMADVGFLSASQDLIHDRDTKFCPAFQRTIEAVGVKTVKLPARSPNLNAFAERWILSVKNECLSKLILFGEAALRRCLTSYLARYHGETKPSRQGERHSLSVCRKQRSPKRANPLSGKPRRAAETLLPGRRMSFLTTRAGLEPA